MRVRTRAIGKTPAMKHVNLNFNLDVLFPCIDSSSSEGFSKEKGSCHTCLLYGRTDEGTVFVIFSCPPGRQSSEFLFGVCCSVLPILALI